ncbi:helix-turn-helix domain-containing protein [Salicibibacter cibi]|uniref:Helix-turn-helix domain-containing protein n=1 Tax=Salicibibacter cibi TaxID=2743001 RepID=A0A7T7CGQ5_9BACI|nr:helix-turn-helix domain-containing protein [Salicibibacter cibi]QQK81364.1 helix-turn-helix domain-containing protein [Salicibibacter cibi]
MIRHYVKEAQRGDREKLATLIHQFEPKIRNCLWQTTPGERDDLRQELMLKLIEITLHYDPEKAPTFTEFNTSLHVKKT